MTSFNHEMMELQPRRWPPLGSQITQLSGSPQRGAFLMLEAVCGNHCSMGWPWDGRHRIISSSPMRRDGAHLSSAGVPVSTPSSSMRNSPNHLISGGPKWPYIPFGSTISLRYQTQSVGSFRLQLLRLKSPTPEYLWAASWSTSRWKVTGVTSCCRSCIWTS